MEICAVVINNKSGNTAVSNIFFDEYLKYLNDAQIKVYLLLLRSLGCTEGFELEDIAKLLDYSVEDIKRAFFHLGKVGLLNLELDDARIAQEVALLSDKWDVSEEITRFESHIDKFKNIIANENESPGRKLDFLTQEIMREINTMGAKVNDASFRWGVVEAKTCIERMREQLQNIE